MRLLAALLIGVLAAGTGAVPAAATTTAPVFRSARLTTTDPVVPMSDGCAHRTHLVAVLDDPDRLISVARTRSRISATFAHGNTWYARHLTARRAGRTLTLSSPALLCGYGAASVRRNGSDGPGRYHWLLRVAYGASGAITVTRAFQLRQRGEMTLDAGPEPARRGALVTVRATVSDGWEQFTDTRVGFWFRPHGSPRYTFRGSVRTRCVDFCGSSFAVLQARARLRQPRAGIWKAVSWATPTVSSVTGHDAVPAACGRP